MTALSSIVLLSNAKIATITNLTAMMRLTLLSLLFISAFSALGTAFAADDRLLLPATGAASQTATVNSANSVTEFETPLDFTSSPATKTTISVQKLAHIVRQIDLFYVNDIDTNVLLEGALKEVFKQLDPHSSYLNEEEVTELFSLANGSYNGVGIEVEIRDEHLVILATLPHSPAELAGLVEGDIVNSINGIDVKGLTLQGVSEIIKNTAKKTQLLVKRDNYPQPIEFILEKTDIAVESVVGRLLSHDIGYAKIHSFQSNTTYDLANEIKRLAGLASHGLKGLVIDLRDNPGGVLESAVGVSDLFLDGGTIVTTKGRYLDANRQFVATKGDLLTKRPIFVLINKGSASASEIVAAALKENGRATLLGVQSYGKGSVQSLIPLADGITAIKLTTALYYTPDGVSINGIGITPDIEILQQDPLASEDQRTSEMPDDRQANSATHSPASGSAGATGEVNGQWGVSGKMLAKRDFQLDAAEQLVLKQIRH